MEEEQRGPVPVMWEDDDGPDKLRATGRGLLEMYHQTVRHNRILAVEHEFQVPRRDPVTGKELDECLVGVVDLMEQEADAHCLDYRAEDRSQALRRHETQLRPPGDHLRAGPGDPGIPGSARQIPGSAEDEEASHRNLRTAPGRPAVRRDEAGRPPSPARGGRRHLLPTARLAVRELRLPGRLRHMSHVAGHRTRTGRAQGRSRL
jgi:hypothetical protein